MGRPMVYRSAGRPIEDGVVGWALDVLYGIDLPAGPDGRFLHDDAQLRTWFKEFQRRSSPESA